jgi:hypothetical protein
MIFRRSGRWYSDVSYIYTFVCAYKVFKMEVSFLCRKLNDFQLWRRYTMTENPFHFLEISVFHIHLCNNNNNNII